MTSDRSSSSITFASEVADAPGPESSAKKSNGLDDKGMVLASSREHYSLVNAFMKRGVPIL